MSDEEARGVAVWIQSAPPLGDLRELPEGSTVYLHPTARDRKDWGRYQEAIGAAVGRGVNVQWMRWEP